MQRLALFSCCCFQSKRHFASPISCHIISPPELWSFSRSGSTAHSHTTRRELRPTNGASQSQHCIFLSFSAGGLVHSLRSVASAIKYQSDHIRLLFGLSSLDIRWWQSTTSTTGSILNRSALTFQKSKMANGLVQLIAGPWRVSMNTKLPFHRSGTGPAGRRAGRVPSLPMRAIHPPRQPAIPDEGR